MSHGRRHDPGSVFGSLTIVERLDNERGYWPGNVRWATPTEQAANRRSKSHYRGALL